QQHRDEGEHTDFHHCGQNAPCGRAHCSSTSLPRYSGPTSNELHPGTSLTATSNCGASNTDSRSCSAGEFAIEGTPAELIAPLPPPASVSDSSSLPWSSHRSCWNGAPSPCTGWDISRPSPSCSADSLVPSWIGPPGGYWGKFLPSAGSG